MSSKSKRNSKTSVYKSIPLLPNLLFHQVINIRQSLKHVTSNIIKNGNTKINKKANGCHGNKKNVASC